MTVKLVQEYTMMVKRDLEKVGKCIFNKHFPVWFGEIASGRVTKLRTSPTRRDFGRMSQTFTGKMDPLKEIGLHRKEDARRQTEALLH